MARWYKYTILIIFFCVPNSSFVQRAKWRLSGWGGLLRHFSEPDLFRQEFFGGVFNTPSRVHLYIRNTEAAIKLRYPGHYLVIARPPRLLHENKMHSNDSCMFGAISCTIKSTESRNFVYDVYIEKVLYEAMKKYLEA